MATIATELVEAKRDERGRRITPAAEREALVRAYPESGLTLSPAGLNAATMGGVKCSHPEWVGRS